ncbi:cbb3-type cytochrome oxidase subunit 3 [Undibacterium sp. GrIS 1.8]|uniref:cbb3-type cytochrome oxidase subunit 3 n=1 Tax=unclassified Undibacterium TaxID=2630295 RepID=UPI0033988C1D
MEFVTFLTDMRSITTVACLLVFLGIVYWSYNGKQQTAFDEAANLPFADEFVDGLPDTPQAQSANSNNSTHTAESHHG